MNRLCQTALVVFLLILCLLGGLWIKWSTHPGSYASLEEIIASEIIYSLENSSLVKSGTKSRMYFEYGQIFLLVLINGKGPFYFILDSGCLTSVINPKLADELRFDRIKFPFWVNWFSRDSINNKKTGATLPCFRASYFTLKSNITNGIFVALPSDIFSPLRDSRWRNIEGKILLDGGTAHGEVDLDSQIV